MLVCWGMFRIPKAVSQPKGGFLWVVLLLSVVEFTAEAAMAQLDTGRITGTVTDATGAVVPGAKITLKNEGTRIATSTMSTQTGTYSLNEIRPGTYSLEAHATGFQGVVETGVKVHVQQTLTIDINFVPGAVTDQITVTAAVPLLQSETAALGQTITSQTVNDLPLQTRNWASLAQLSAGVTTAAVHAMSADAGSTSSPFFSVNGVNVWQNDFRLNGINDNTEFFGGNAAGTNAAIIPPPDAIEEFKLQSGNFNAEFGHSTGAVINAAIKSGTNRIHGDVWEYLRNDVFNANLFFNNATHAPTPEYRQNLFGFTLGGPVYIPKTLRWQEQNLFFRRLSRRTIHHVINCDQHCSYQRNDFQPIYEFAESNHVQQWNFERSPWQNFQTWYDLRPSHDAPGTDWCCRSDLRTRQR